MSKKKIIAVCPCDDNNAGYFNSLEKSLRKFHSAEELPLIRVINENNDQMFWYKATPIMGKEFIKDYEIVLKLDADQIITGSFLEYLEGDYDVAVVNNSNPREFKAYPYQFLNINPLSYVNCGFVAMKSEAFIDWWLNICNSPLFNATQMREQDWLNVMVHSDNYKVKRMDEGNSYFGLASKGFWPDIKLEDNQLVLYPQPDDKWPDKKKTIRVIHIAGGNDKRFNLKTRFQPEVVERIKELVK